MPFLDAIRSRISPHNPLLLMYHKLLAVAAAVFYGFPGGRIKVIAITGTKGKSTTTHLLAGILQEAGFKVGVASTIHFQIGEEVWPNATKQTTQGRFRLQRLLRAMVRARCDVAILEVTSHALVQSRLWGVKVQTAVLTNIQRDHLEYHGGFQNYLHAKGRLFSQLARGTAVLPSEDANVAYFKAFPAHRKILYGKGGALTARHIEPHADGSRFTLAFAHEKVSIDFKMPGEFNIQNALAAAGAALSIGVKLSAIKKGLEKKIRIPGRLEAINAGQPFSVIVDYAHTAESLQKLLALYRGLTPGKLFLVFGATGGGRDKSKRPEMGRVADRYADFIVVTDDDPYTEDRMAIINQVAEGIARKEGEGLLLIRDRREAIRHALTRAKAGDTVIIAGKGCEPIQVIGTEKIPWDDRAVAREIIKNL